MVVYVNHFNDPYILGYAFSITPTLQHSITPTLQYSNTPTLQYSFGGQPKPYALSGPEAELGFFTYSCYASLRAMRRSSHWTPKESIIHMTRYMAVTVSHISMVT